jgi:uncharacterized protein (DUF486 family)
MRTIILLIFSNIFMTIAWYGHLKWFPRDSLPKVILISWSIALLEYCFQVPANRIGYEVEGFSAFQLKMIQEIITLTIFCFFTILVLKEQLRWNHLVAFGFILAGAFFMFKKF